MTEPIRRRLSARLWRGFVLQAVAIAVATLGGLWGADYVMRHLLIEEALQHESVYYWAKRQSGLDVPPPSTFNLDSFVVDLDDVGKLPASLAALKPGYYDMEDDDMRSVVHVSDFEGQRLYLGLNTDNLSRLSWYYGLVPLGSMLLVVYGSVWISFRFARRMVSPLAELARRVEQLDVRQPDSGLFDADVPGGADEETALLAGALQHLTRRLDEFAAREQAFTADVSHEMRSPLTSMRLTIDLLARRPDIDSATRSAVVRLERAARDLEELLTTFLMLAREDAPGQGDDTVSVNACVRDELARCAETIDPDVLELRLVAHGQLDLRSAPTVLRVVIGNLLRNACHYTEKGSVTVAIHATHLAIVDTGIGIPPDELPRVFERGHRARNAGAADGCGLGLAIVKRLVERMRWSLGARSAEGRGTVFELRFPPADVSFTPLPDGAHSISGPD